MNRKSCSNYQPEARPSTIRQVPKNSPTQAWQGRSKELHQDRTSEHGKGEMQSHGSFSFVHRILSLLVFGRPEWRCAALLLKFRALCSLSVCCFLLSHAAVLFREHNSALRQVPNTGDLQFCRLSSIQHAAGLPHSLFRPFLQGPQQGSRGCK